MKMDDKQLVKKIISGDTRAFREFVDLHKRLVAHVVFRMVNNPADREDLCQDVFVKAYQNVQGFHFQSKLSTWLARIAYNTCVNYLEKKKLPLLDDTSSDDKTIEDVVSSTDDPYTVLEESDTRSFIQRHINALPVLYRTVITLYHLEDMKYSEIAEVMKMPEGTVKSYLFRARSMLKDSKSLREDVLW
jgi:RNA polymerase sigma-70 factor (ECF subfamily)